MARTVGLIGLGRMGIPMGVHMQSHLAARGDQLIGFDLSEAARSAAHEAGLRVMPDLDQLLRDSSILITMLPGSPMVEAVLLGDAARENLRSGTVVMDMSSSEPLSTRRLAEDLEQRGITLIDAPVSGGVVGAVAGTLTIMVGGDDTTVETMTPLLSSMGKVVRTGAVGSGHALKALNNLLSGTHLLVSAEALEIGRRFGLSDDIMLEVINASTGRSWSTQFKLPTFIIPETYNSGFAMSLLVKDMTIATDLARELGLPSRLGETSRALWAQASGELGPEADHTEIARFAAHPDA